jgi:uncharacterized protein YndB with AHSA1/START domain
MTVTSISGDTEARTMTFTAEFDAPAVRVWHLWEDPRLLERWWGPPTYPATFVDHDLRPGGRSSYYMTGPEGDRPRGWWRALSVDPPNRLEFENGFADEDGKPDPAMPVMVIRVMLKERPQGGTRMISEIECPSMDAMEKILSTGMEEGMTAAMGQMDALL